MAELKFEEALRKLEKIVEELESGDLPLEGSLKKYEEGVKLIQLCSKKLNSTQKKVEILVKEGGKIQTQPFKSKTE